jgi:polyribonucleotide nucleotidyltransferase
MYASNTNGRREGEKMSKEFKSYSMDLAGRKLTAEIGRVCAQANGAVLLHYGANPTNRNIPVVGGKETDV